MKLREIEERINTITRENIEYRRQIEAAEVAALEIEENYKKLEDLMKKYIDHRGNIIYG